ncbi:MAG TPA: hypothetical protein GX729_01635 [Firmicutes bacterium]|nr:hypothetical protein [Bacillota bacterium]
MSRICVLVKLTYANLDFVRCGLGPGAPTGNFRWWVLPGMSKSGTICCGTEVNV